MTDQQEKANWRSRLKAGIVLFSISGLLLLYCICNEPANLHDLLLTKLARLPTAMSFGASIGVLAGGTRGVMGGGLIGLIFGIAWWTS
jgi:hypothetical protein